MSTATAPVTAEYNNRKLLGTFYAPVVKVSTLIVWVCRICVTAVHPDYAVKKWRS